MRKKYTERTTEDRALHCERQRDYTRRNPQVQCAHAASNRARAAGLPYDYRFLRTMTCPTLCPILGTEISFAYGQGQRPRESVASFDQIVAGKGYVPGNVQIISMLANQMKSNATREQLALFARWVLSATPDNE